MLRLAAVVLGKTDSALGAFYRRLAARAGKAVAVTATARKIATIFYNTLRYGIADLLQLESIFAQKSSVTYCISLIDGLKTSKRWCHRISYIPLY